jgi:hypothetical protein
MKEQILFAETQRFGEFLIWLVLFFANGIAAGFLIKSRSIKYNPPNIKPVVVIVAGISVLIVFSVTALFFTAKLETVILADKIKVRFYPFQSTFKQYTNHEIKSACVRTYNSLAEFGGWGIRTASDQNKAFNVSGNQGIELIFADGNKLLIGTQKPNEAQEALQKSGLKTAR